MADPRSTTMTLAELNHLADRLYSRDVSELSTVTTEQSRDLRIASQALRVLLHEIDRVAAVANDLGHTLTNLRISVEG